MQESEAIRGVFGAHAEQGLSVSSTKSMTGHLLGAAGGLEAVFTALSLKHGVLPPTVNLDEPEEGTQGLDLVPNQAKEKAVKVALSNSFGFGGTNCTLVMKRHEP
jgi:3-oxoacyl-[acyl-carrier-protein] synthase II